MAERATYTFRLGVDLDNVVFREWERLWQELVYWFDADPTACPALPTAWSYHECDGFRDYLRGAEDFQAIVVKALWERDYYATMPIEPGALDVIRGLANLGVKIVPITSRMWTGAAHQEVLRQTAVALDGYEVWRTPSGEKALRVLPGREGPNSDLPYTNITFEDNKADHVCDMYVDDSPTHIEALRRAGRQVIAFDRPYNRDVATQNGVDMRASSWAEVGEIVLTRLRELGVDAEALPPKRTGIGGRVRSWQEHNEVLRTHPLLSPRAAFRGDSIQPGSPYEELIELLDEASSLLENLSLRLHPHDAEHDDVEVVGREQVTKISERLNAVRRGHPCTGAGLEPAAIISLDKFRAPVVLPPATREALGLTETTGEGPELAIDLGDIHPI